MSDVLIGIACEDRGHFTVVTRLVDDALVERYTWLQGVLDSCRRWRGIHENTDWYKYKPDDAQGQRPITVNGQRVPLHGHIGGEPLKTGARMWRNVLRLFCGLKPHPEVVILAQDMDGDLERRSGLVQVRDGIPWPFEIVAAIPEPEIEAWQVAGFVPKGADEEGLLAAVRKELSFDPTTESHRLTSRPNDAATDAKRVRSRLSGDEPERLDACLADRSLLRRRGAHNGLATFLSEVDERIVPKFGRAP